MEKNKCGNRYSPEVRERAVGIVFEHQGEFDSQSAAIKSIAPKIPYISTQCRFSFMGGFGRNRLSRRGNFLLTGGQASCSTCGLVPPQRQYHAFLCRPVGFAHP